jgi:hypothetical protein
MNPFEMVVAIVAIVSIASVIRAKYGVVRRHKGEEFVGRVEPDPEAEKLREEIRQLKARVATLERIATDTSSSLDREIESLRDRH